jgi:hypothetical protein
MNKTFSTKLYVILSVILALIVVFGLTKKYIPIKKEISVISSFQECKDAGYPIMESYPEQCATPDG